MNEECGRKQYLMAWPLDKWYLLMPAHGQVTYLNFEICDIWLISENQ